MLNNHRTVKSATRRLHAPISMGMAPVDGLPLNILIGHCYRGGARWEMKGEQ
jgi:hypothetical protein